MCLTEIVHNLFLKIKENVADTKTLLYSVFSEEELHKEPLILRNARSNDASVVR